jgi:hypothetical protein
MNVLNALAGAKRPEKKEVEREYLMPDQIRTDGGTQPRAAIDQEVVKQYRADMEAGLWDWERHELPLVFYDGKDYWLASGFHRHAATSQLERSMPVEVRQGTRRDAVLASVGTNTDHGLRRTNADKRRAVTTLLQDEEWKLWADREIARRCGVDNHLVAKIRAELNPPSEDRPQIGGRQVQRGASTYTMSTGNIGSKPAATPPEQSRDEEDSSALFRADESGQLTFAHTAQPAVNPVPAVDPGLPPVGDEPADPVATDPTPEPADVPAADLDLPPSAADQEIAAVIKAFKEAFDDVWLIEREIAQYVKRIPVHTNTLNLLKLNLPDVKRAIDGN